MFRFFFNSITKFRVRELDELNCIRDWQFNFRIDAAALESRVIKPKARQPITILSIEGGQ